MNTHFFVLTLIYFSMYGLLSFVWHSDIILKSEMGIWREKLHLFSANFFSCCIAYFMYLNIGFSAVAQNIPSGNDIVHLCGIYFLNLKNTQ